ncbi:MAG: hypothetical protein JWO56_895, partial [Acidobacteria bacterium]|nr:hypothetical protein [Acidobacteriota bacterium]
MNELTPIDVVDGIASLLARLTKLDDFSEAMNISARYARELTRASGAAIELADGGDMVCHAASGSLLPQRGLRWNGIRCLSGATIQS